MILKGYISKPAFYFLVVGKIKELGICEKDYPIDSIKIASTMRSNLSLYGHENSLLNAGNLHG